MSGYGSGTYGGGWYGLTVPDANDDWGAEPDAEGSIFDPAIQWNRAVQQGSVRNLWELTVTVPGGQPVELTVESLTVTQEMDAGSRWSADATIVREVGQSTWELVTTPGAIFRARFGFDFGGGHEQWRPAGVYELGAAPKANRTETITVNLLDQWKRLEECRLVSPLVAAVGTGRAGLVSSVVEQAIPGVGVRQTTNGGEVGAETTWDRDRTSVINDLARDGEFDAYFDAEGVFVIEPDPVVNEARAVVSFTDGANATIVDLSTEQVYTRLYNGVVVTPQDGDDSGGTGTSTQTWSPVAVWISDPEHPRHPDKIGFRPAFYSSPTLPDNAAARRAGKTLLKRFVNALERVEIVSWGRGDLRPGQTITTVQSPTYTDGPRAGVWLVEKVVFDATTTATTITARSNADVPTEE